MRPLLLTSITTAVALTLTTAARAEPHSRIEADWFPFGVPALSNGATSGSPIDLSFLSPDPAGSHGRLVARDDGEIVDGQGTVVKLFGTNVCDFHAMPPLELARPIAVRLRELGVNFVRLHYYDYAAAPEGMMKPDGRTLDPTKLDQFHHFVAELAAAGVYTDVNLHVARHYPEQPAEWSDWMGKGVDRVLPRLIEDQKSFARQVLTTPNPHRDGKSLAEDPAVAFVEINNENSLMREGWTRLSSLPAGDLGPLARRWNDFLVGRYGDTAALREAWNDGLTSGGGEKLPKGVADLALESGGDATLRPDAGRSAVRWTVTRAGPNPWSHQLHDHGVAVKDGDAIVLRLRYRGTGPVGVRLMHDGSPWTSATPSVSLPASREWRDVAVSWTVADDAPAVPLRLSFDAGNRPGTYEIADLSLRPGALPGVTEGQSLEDGTVPVPGLTGNGRAVAAWRDFCESLELDYTAEMTRFLKGDLGVTAMIWDTQANYGGGVGLVRESRFGDVIDLHGYPAHPTDVTQPDGPRTWQVSRKSVLGEGLGEWTSAGFWQVGSMPLAMTEFDLNPPQDYNSESYPMLSLLAAYQGWDLLGEYAWHTFEPGEDPQTLYTPFHTAGNPAQIAFMPASALMFRLGLVEPAGDAATLSVHEEAMLDADLGWSSLKPFWRGFGADDLSPLRQRLLVNLEPGDGEASISGKLRPGDAAGVTVSDTKQIRLDRTTAGKETLTVDAPALKMAFGHTLGKTFDLGDVRIEVTQAGTLAGDYANVALVALDGRPVAESQKLLLTAVARVHGEGWRFQDDADTTVIFGEGQNRAEPVAVRLSMPGGSWRMSPLDGTGRPAGGGVGGASGATLDTAGLNSLWFLIEPAGE